MSLIDTIIRSAVRADVVTIEDAHNFIDDTPAKVFLRVLIEDLIESNDVGVDQNTDSDYWAEVLKDTLKDEGILLYDAEQHRYNVSFVTDTGVHLVTVDTFLNESENEAIIALAQEFVPPVVLVEVISTDIQEA